MIVRRVVGRSSRLLFFLWAAETWQLDCLFYRNGTGTKIRLYQILYRKRTWMQSLKQPRVTKIDGRFPPVSWL